MGEGERGKLMTTKKDFPEWEGISMIRKDKFSVLQTKDVAEIAK